MSARGQIDMAHIGTALVTAFVLGVGGFLWSLVKPDEAKAVDYALMKQDVATLKTDVASLKAQGTRIETVLIRMENGETVRPASGKRP